MISWPRFLSMRRSRPHDLSIRCRDSPVPGQRYRECGAGVVEERDPGGTAVRGPGEERPGRAVRVRTGRGSPAGCPAGEGRGPGHGRHHRRLCLRVHRSRALRDRRGDPLRPRPAQRPVARTHEPDRPQPRRGRCRHRGPVVHARRHGRVDPHGARHRRVRGGPDNVLFDKVRIGPVRPVPGGGRLRVRVWRPHQLPRSARRTAARRSSSPGWTQRRGPTS